MTASVVLEPFAIEASASILEVGGGGAGLSAELARVGAHVTALDNRAHAAEQARQRFGHLPNVTIVEAL